MTTPTSLLCPRCGERSSPNLPRNLCGCGSPLLAEYDLASLRQTWRKEDLAGREASMWRYWELLPVEDRANLVTLGEGWTPILPLRHLGAETGLPELLLKDEGLSPTATFKARGAAAGVSRAKELGIRQVAMPTAGNAGGAWAAYCARAGLDLHVVMPVDTPEMNKLEAQAYGAHVYLVRGLISDAGRIVTRAMAEHGWFDASTLKEPYRIEGKKTMGYEIAEQLGWELPQAILYPAGGGVGLIGMWKAFDELEALGWIGRRRPKLIAVQAEGCAPLVRAFEDGREESSFWEDAETIASGLRVPKALGDFLVLRAIRETEGYAIAVSDRAILEASGLLARTEGLFVCPEGAATVAALPELLRRGVLRSQDRALLLNTGSGLKYPDTVQARELPVLEPGDRIGSPSQADG
ncbi:MAG: threonine synthase [Chloroflexi bacterium]|nr:threonine synthase [Chloroflexota bacterium]